MTDADSAPDQAERPGPDRFRRSPREARPRDETSVVSGLMGITAVATATLVVSLVGAAISLLVALLY